MRWIVLALGLTSPGAPALLERADQRPDEPAGGAADDKGWLAWLGPAAPLRVVGIGCGIVLGYYYGFVGRKSPVRR